MKTTRWTLGLAAALLATAAFDAAGQCENAFTLADMYGASTPVLPNDFRVEIRPDQSNPGARALGLGGAFLSSADDATSVIANPAGLGAMVRPAMQIEVRPADQVQYDRLPDGYSADPRNPGEPFIQNDFSSGFPPFFASFVIPVADKLVVAAFYQKFMSADRTVDRGGSPSRGPCYSTVAPISGAAIAAYPDTYILNDRSEVWRAGASVGFRATYQLTFGATVYYAKESRDFTVTGGNPLNPGAGRVEPYGSNDGKPGFILGVQYTPTENLRLGAVFSSEVDLIEEERINKALVLPMRIGLGLNVSPSSSLSLSLEGVFVGSSAFAKEVNYARGFSTWAAFPGAESPAIAGNWDSDDSFEARFGLEWSVVQTRTQIFALRAGYYGISPSNVRYTAGEATTVFNRALYDYVRYSYPNVNDPWLHHVTGGLGAVFNKKFQIDVGADYEFAETKALAVSMLLGYTF